MIWHLILNTKQPSVSTCPWCRIYFDSVCHMSLFPKLIKSLLWHNWYNKLNAVVKWNSSYSKSFCVTYDTWQGSVLSLYLFNICINQLLLDLNTVMWCRHQNRWYTVQLYSLCRWYYLIINTCSTSTKSNWCMCWI